MITSLDNNKVKEFTKLHQKKYREDKFLVLDKYLIKIAFEEGYLDTLIYCDKLPFEFSNVIEVNQDVLNKISKKDGLKYIGICKQIKDNDNYSNRVILLDHLQDPLNIGRIMEAAYLFGFDSIIISEDCADIYNKKCLDNCKGAIFKLNIHFGNLKNEIEKLKELGFIVYATGLRNNTKELRDIKEQNKMAFILGNEGSGVSAEIMDIADEIVKIDMRNIDSLNVGMAGSIIMYKFSK